LIDPSHPVIRRADRPVGEIHEVARVQPVPQARPSPILRAANEIRSQGVALYITADRQEMLVEGDRK